MLLLLLLIATLAVAAAAAALAVVAAILVLHLNSSRDLFDPHATMPTEISGNGGESLSSRALRKRPALSLDGSGSCDANHASSATTASTLATYEPPTRRARRDVLSCELETAQAELEHERSLRLIDAKRFQQTQQRMEKQMEFALEEAKDAKALMEVMEEMRVENERHLEQQKRARAQLQEELRQVRSLLEETEANVMEDALEEDPRVATLKEDLEAQELENDQLKQTIQVMRRDMKELMERQAAAAASSRPTRQEDDEGMLSPGAASEARPAVLKELNKVRIQLAESERKNRQLKRAAEDSQRKSKQLVQEKEVARSATKRVEQLEAALQQTTRSHETAWAESKAWKDFGMGVIKSLTGRDHHSVSSSWGDSSIPPDMTVVTKWIDDVRKEATDAGADQMISKAQFQQARDTIRRLEAESRAFEQKESSWRRERQDLEKKLTRAETNVSILKGQEGVLKNEMESLRTIIKTFDELPVGKGTAPSNVPTASAQTRMMEAGLTAAREEIAVLKNGAATLQKEVNSVLLEREELRGTHNKVLEKFGKLKDALYEERAKSEKAEERANQAELLAGKGSFNADRTRVLHLSKNPLTEALKEEINVLRRQVDHLTTSAGRKKNKGQGADVDPEKLHQRLKESFREQISRFREGVALMTGFRVEMIPGDKDRCRFKVKSIFAERESDHLMFQWPEGDNVTSLDLLNTEQAKILTRTPAYQYVEKFGSLPAFLASTQLTLFESQTMM